MCFNFVSGVRPVKEKNALQGFSLLELMVVLVILAMFMSIAFPSYQHYLKEGRASKIKGELMNLAASVEVYKQASLSYAGAQTADLYQAKTNETNKEPHFIVTVHVSHGGQRYLLSASANPKSTQAQNDGVYWFNPAGPNCYFTEASDYNVQCSGGTEW